MHAKTTYYMHANKFRIICTRKQLIICTAINFVSYARQYISYHMHAKTAYYMHANKFRIMCTRKLLIICTPINFVSYARENSLLYARQYISYHMHAKTAYYMHANKFRIICTRKLLIICTPTNFVSYARQTRAYMHAKVFFFFFFAYQYHKFLFLFGVLYAFSRDRAIEHILTPVLWMEYIQLRPPSLAYISEITGVSGGSVSKELL